MPLRWLSIEVEPTPVETPGIVHRTAPSVGRGSDGERYYFKRGTLDGVVAEVLGYSLAEAVGLPVPRWALCRMPPRNDIYFASEAMSFNSAVDSLIAAGAVTNTEFLKECIAFDIWTANTDRNAGNVVASAAPGRRGHVELFAIDFEQAKVLNGTDFLKIGSLHSSECWPRGALASCCQSLAYPSDMCGRIERMTEPAINEALADVETDIEFPRPSWLDAAKWQAGKRAAQIQELVKEAWNA